MAEPLPSNEELAKGTHSPIGLADDALEPKAMVTTLPTGKKVFSRRRSPVGSTIIEPLAFHLARKVGVLTPRIEVRSGVPGWRTDEPRVVQDHINGRTLMPLEIENPSPELSKAQLFRYALGDPDAHEENFLRTPGGKLVSLDHEFAFSPDINPAHFQGIGHSLGTSHELDPAHADDILRHRESFLDAARQIKKHELPRNILGGATTKPGLDPQRALDEALLDIDPHEAMAHRFDILQKWRNGNDHTVGGLMRVANEHAEQLRKGNK